ncbi:hypothetical protein LTR37_017105 [Vermiconidia calcicola]|uniref:Uncharacterized protein n=1 Tax=Vermiconidia calcicola TaxID=1690605 RepID=A0ACC3ML14_9PEZI|nr:hypothetical protein LTR37_017105 [Vermiconidia calcicola]
MAPTMLRLTFALLPSLAASIPLTVTQYASTCSAGSAIYTSGTNTYTLPITPTASTIAASVTPVPQVDVCPAYNALNYTDSSGGSYAVSCDVAVTGTRLSNMLRRQQYMTVQPSQQSCITSCQENTACVALNLGLASCEYFSNVTGTKDAPGFAALVIINRSADSPPTDSYTPVERTVVSTMIVSVFFELSHDGHQYLNLYQGPDNLCDRNLDGDRHICADHDKPGANHNRVNFYQQLSCHHNYDHNGYQPGSDNDRTDLQSHGYCHSYSNGDCHYHLYCVRNSNRDHPTKQPWDTIWRRRWYQREALMGKRILPETRSSHVERLETFPYPFAWARHLLTLLPICSTGFANPNFIRSGLFNLGGLRGDQYDTQTVYYGTDGEYTYQIPEFLGFTWASQFNSETVTGETKGSYQQSLSQSYSANLGFAGFGVEIQNTFEESSLVETYKKYASIYARQQIYHVSVREDATAMQAYLSPRAVSLFQSGNARSIVDTFGTHYMTNATFGGMKRFASTLDARDENISTKLGQALKAKFAAQTEAGEISGGAGSANSDETVQKISNSMETKSTVVFGGTYVESDEGSWVSIVIMGMRIPSVYRNPSGIDFQLASLADLILDPTLKAAVQAEIDSRVQTSAVTSTALALVMWESLGSVRSDAGSDLTTAMTNSKQGWYTLGQYGVGFAGWNAPLSKGLLIRNLPASSRQIVIRPDGIQRCWGKSSSYGLYEIYSNQSSFYALSGFWYKSDSATNADLENNRAGMVHESITLPTNGGGELWNDGGSGAEDDASVQRVYYGLNNDDSIRIFQIPDGQPEAYFFHTNQDGSTFRKLDFTKVQFVSNRFINPA